MNKGGFKIRHYLEPLAFFVPRKSVYYIIATTLLVAVFASTFFLKIHIPKTIERNLPLLLKGYCPSCRLDLGRVSLRLFPLKVVLNNPTFIMGDKTTTEIDARVAQVIARISLLKLIYGHIHFKYINIDSPDVKITEGDIDTPSFASRAARVEKSWWTASSAEQINAVQGAFMYIREHKKRVATLSLQNIDADIGAWGTTAGYRIKTTHAKATGLLEKSGRFVLDVATPLFSDTLQVDVTLRIDDQNLAGINQFFENNDGVKLKGTLVNGQSLMAIRGPTLRGWVRVKYFGLGMNFEKTRERKAISAFFSNLVKSVQLISGNMDKPSQDRKEHATLQRKSDESIIQFVLRGMQNAAFQIIMRFS